MAALNGHFELTVKASGALTLPAKITGGLPVVPGDLFSLHGEPHVLYLGIYHEFLADNWDALSAENRWRYLKKFLSRPLTALDRRRNLAIPEEVFPLRKGEKVWLYVMSRGLSHCLFLFRKGKDDPKPRTGNLVARAAAGSVRDALADGGLRCPLRPPLIAEPPR